MANPTIKTKIFLLLIGTFLFLEAINICTGSVFLYVSYKNLEHEFEAGNNERVIHALNNDINALEMTASDWAIWDDMYNFVNTRNQAFSNSNLNVTSLENNKLNMLYCFDRHGGIIWGMDYDFEKDTREKYGIFPDGRIDRNSPLATTLDIGGKPARGILRTPKGYLLVSACPIMRSDRSGPANGVLLMGKFLNEGLRRKLEKQTNLSFDIIETHNVHIDKTNVPIDKSATPGSFIRTENNGEEYFFTPVAGIDGDTAFYIKRLSPGDIRKNGARTILFAQLLLLLSIATVGAVILRAIYLWIIHPLDDLLTRIQIIKSSEVYIDNLPVAYDNEIGTLTKEFNSLMNMTKNQRILLEEKTELLESLARVDQLTHLYNRHHLDDMLKSEWNRLKKENRPLTFILMDVDHYKSFNDTYGHVTGDECLKKIADIIRSTAIRFTDIAARYGGDELALLLPGTTEEGGLIVATKIAEGLNTCAIEHRGSPVGIVTLSIGIATMIPSDDVKSLEIIKNTDKALYQSKSEGRNRISIFRKTQESV